MPVIIQEYLEPKIDLRVTVIGGQAFSAAIMREGRGVAGDWRLHKEGIGYEKLELDRTVESRCVQLTRALGLAYGALDLAIVDGEVYFLEINPTGEWAWLVDSIGLPIDKAIVDWLMAS